MKLSIKDLMDVAHDVAVENFGSLSFNFASLWAKTWAKAKSFKKADIEEWIGSFFVELLIDTRFVYIGPNQWKLREYMDYSEYMRVMGRRAQEISFSQDVEVDEDKGSESLESTSEEVVERVSSSEDQQFEEVSGSGEIEEESSEGSNSDETGEDEDSYD